MTGIIDGLGSLGTAIGSLVLGITLESYGWKYGFLMIIATVMVLTLVPLCRIFIKDIKDIRKQLRES